MAIFTNTNNIITIRPNESVLGVEFGDDILRFISIYGTGKKEMPYKNSYTNAKRFFF